MCKSAAKGRNHWFAPSAPVPTGFIVPQAFHAFHEMRTYPWSRCSERAYSSSLRTPCRMVEICQPEACTSQLAPRTCSSKKQFSQRHLPKAFQLDRLCSAETDASRIAPVKPSQQKLKLPCSQGWRQCVACNVRRRVGMGLPSDCSSRSNCSSSRPFSSNQSAARSATDNPHRICKQPPSVAVSVSIKPPVTCRKTSPSVQGCPCLTACQQKRDTSALCGCVCICYDCGEPTAVHTPRWCSAPLHLQRCAHIPRQGCRRCQVPFRDDEIQESKCDKRAYRIGGDYARSPLKTSPKQLFVEHEPPHRAEVGSGDEDDRPCEDGKTTVQWALRNVRTEAARTRRVLEGCRSQLLAREQKLKASRKSPRACGKQSPIWCTPPYRIVKNGGDTKGAAPLTTATSAVKGKAVTSQVGESNAHQHQQQPHKEQDEMVFVFKHTFEQEMRAFCRSLRTVAGNLNDKLSMLYERETHLKLTAEELQKERENASRLRRIYFNATNKNKQLAERNTSLERALLDVELKLCRPYNVWKVLGCPAGAALRSELQGDNRLYDTSTSASDSSSAQKSASPRAKIPMPRRRACSRACTSNWAGTTGGECPSCVKKHSHRNASCRLSEGKSAVVSTDHACSPGFESRLVQERLIRSVPCFLHSYKVSQGNIGGDHRDDSSQQTQQILSKATQRAACTTGEGTQARKAEDMDPHKGEDTREKLHHRASSSLQERRQQKKAEQERGAENLAYQPDASADGETMCRRPSRDGGVKKLEYYVGGLTQKPGKEREGSASFAPISLCSQSPYVLCKNLLFEHHPTAADPSAPLSPHDSSKTSLPADRSADTPRSEKTASITKCASFPACLALLAAPESGSPCVRGFAISTNHAKCGCTRDVFRSRHPCSPLIQCTSHEVRERSTSPAVPPREQPCVHQSLCEVERDGYHSSEFLSPRGLRPTCTSSLPNDSCNRRNPSESLTPVCDCCENMTHDTSSNYPSGFKGPAKTLGPYQREGPLTGKDDAAAGVCRSSITGDLRTHTSLSDGEKCYPLEMAGRAAEICSPAEGAAGRRASTPAASKSYPSLAPVTEFACCRVAELTEQSRTTWQTAAADSGPPSLSSSSSSALSVTRRRLHRRSSLGAGLSTAGDSCCLPRQPIGSPRSSTAVLRAAFSNNANCTEDVASSSSSTCSCATLPELTRAGTAFQESGASNGTQGSCSSVPRRLIPTSSAQFCASHNSSKTDCAQPNCTIDRNSGSHSCCCCVNCAVANAGKQELAGCTRYSSEESNVFSPFIGGKDVQTMLRERETGFKSPRDTGQVGRVSRCMSPDASSLCDTADSAVCERKCRSRELPTTADETGRSLHDSYQDTDTCMKADSCMESACSSSSSSSSSSCSSSASIFQSSATSPFASVPIASSSESGFQCSAIPGFSSSAGASSSCDSSFMRFAEEQSRPSCPAPSETCGKKCCHALDGCISWHLPPVPRRHAVP